MSTQVPNIQETLNNGVVQQMADLQRAIAQGDLLGLLLRGMTVTEAAAAVASNAKTLANAASMLYDVVVTAGGSTGRKTLKIGDSTVVPAAGECVWDGASSVRFAAADAVTASNFLYARRDGVNTATSLLARRLGQQDT